MADGFLIGGYGPGMGGTAGGISLARIARDGRLSGVDLAAELPSPSWLAARAGIVYAALEETAEVASLAFDGVALRLVGRHPTAGAAPCHLAAAGDSLVVACYRTGEVGVHPLDRDGIPGPLGQTLRGSGNGPRAAQAGPHAHHVLPLPDGRILTADLGSDQVHVHHWSGGGLARDHSIALAPGSGPRDLLLLPDGWVAVLGEWDCAVHLLAPDGDGFAVADVATLPGAAPGAQAAGLVSADAGRSLYAALRGPDRLAQLGRAGGSLVPRGSVPCAGSRPRGLAVVGEVLHVANQSSGSVASFGLADDGAPALLGPPTAVPCPTCLLRVDLPD